MIQKVNDPKSQEEKHHKKFPCLFNCFDEIMVDKIPPNPLKLIVFLL